ncbi:MAG TPA: diphosphate--fructose-6-phosphate 1-phosphotransferase [Chloroflexota bacterium]
MSGDTAPIKTLLVGQSGGGTPVINASLAGVVAEAQALGVERVLGMRFGIRGLLEEQFVDLTRLTVHNLDVLARTPSAALGLCRHRLTPQAAFDAVEVLRRWDVDALLYIGGNDSAETTLTIARTAEQVAYRLACIGIPKTIDNDLPAMDHTPGYGSAARLIASAVRDLGLDAWAMQREEQVRILEVYGRDTGWLAAASVLARRDSSDAPHVVLVPELPFWEDAFLTSVQRQVSRRGYCCVVVGEMLRDAAGGLLGSGGAEWRDAFGHAETRRPGTYLRELVQQRLSIRAKDDRPGSMQKVLADVSSTVDRQEALALGRAAVRAACAGESERMVTLQRQSDDPYVAVCGLASLAAVAGKVRPLPAEFLDVEGQPTAAFERYARPLIGERLTERLRLKMATVSPPNV